jgi:hypothetical protein
MTELHEAIQPYRPMVEALKLLDTDSGKAMAREHDKNGNLPLHLACARGLIGVIEKLIDVFPKAVEDKGALGFLPLHFAVCHEGNATATLDLLISKYPEGLLCKDTCGRLPIHHAETALTFFHLATICPESLYVSDQFRRPIARWLESSQKVTKKRARFIENIALMHVKKAEEEKKKLQQEMIKLKDSRASYKTRLRQEIIMNREETSGKKLQEELIKIKDTLASVTKDLEYEKKMTNEARKSLAFATKELECEKKMSSEARKVEHEFRSHLLDPKNEAAVSIDTLKAYAVSLKTRLDLTMAKALQNQPPSSNNNKNDTIKPSMVQLMFASFIKDPDVSRSSLLHCIEMLDAELSSFEKQRQEDHPNIMKEDQVDDAAANSNNSKAEAVADSNQSVAASPSVGTADLPSTPSKKRARVSMA